MENFTAKLLIHLNWCAHFSFFLTGFNPTNYDPFKSTTKQTRYQLFIQLTVPAIPNMFRSDAR